MYKSVYYGDLCDVVGLNNSSYLKFGTNCSSLLNSKLHAGITTYFSYLTNYNASQIDQITLAQQYITGPALILILTTWENYFITSIESFKSISNIIIYLYIAATILAFLSFWMIYLNRQNDKMNRTIQMLNMIPMGMMPKNRRDTRDFIEWLIRMANKKK